MTTVALIPDMEKIASSWIRSTLGDVRVVGKPPGDTATAWVQVVQLDARQADNSPADHLVDFLLQLDCYAGGQGGQPEATLLGRRVRAALHGLPGVRNGAVVTAARITGDARIPDTTFEPARERRVITTTIWAHDAVSA